MKSGNYIRNFSAVVLMLTFALSITPTVVFHNVFAHHSDNQIQHRHSHNSEVAKASINCHFDNLVCEGSFLKLDLPAITLPAVATVAHNAVKYISFYSLHHFYSELRGPPSLPDLA